MKQLRIIFASLLFTILFVSCSKNERQEVKEKMDTASHKLGRELDTLINTSIYSDSLYKKAPVENVDSSTASKTFRGNLNDIFEEYSDIKDELADDDSAGVIKQAEEFTQALMKAQTGSASEKLGSKWKLWVASVEKVAMPLKASLTLEKQRTLFSELSSSMESLLLSFGLRDITVYKVSCPIAKQKNNYWLTDSKDNTNPYFGKDKSNEKSIPCIDVQKAWKFN